MDPTRKLATYADLAATPDDQRFEILAGELSALPAPRPRPTNVQRRLGRIIGGPFQDEDGIGGPGGWWILLEAEIELTEHDVDRGDVAGWQRERLPDPDQQPIRVTPDWVCEVLSSNPARDRVAKRRLYASQGVAHYWLVDPGARTVEALSLSNGV